MNSSIEKHRSSQFLFVPVPLNSVLQEEVGAAAVVAAVVLQAYIYNPLVKLSNPIL